MKLTKTMKKKRIKEIAKEIAIVAAIFAVSWLWLLFAYAVGL